MKNKILMFITIITIILCGCTNDSRDRAYQINSSYTFKRNNNEITQKCYIDKNESRFVWSFIGAGCESNYFYFIFDYDSLYLENSREFKYYTSSNNEINFDYVDSTGLDKYEFKGDITIYIYYNYASKEVINIINNDTYNLEICYVKWFSKPEIYI